MPLRLALLLLAIAGSPALALRAQDSLRVAACAVEGPCSRCLWTTGGLLGVGVAGSLIVLDQAWYADYERAPLHTFDDGDEWMQMDKAGHVFSAYTLGAWGHRLLERCGASRNTSRWLGGSIGLIYLTGVELLDGTSAEWGFSWWDMAANAAGTGLFIGQELLWSDQRIRLKFSAHHTDYAAMRADLLGEGDIERYLKDYNGQTIWLSANLHAFAPRSGLPSWLNVAMGYGAEGMITASPPADDVLAYWAPERYRQFYLSPDIDLTRIRTRSKVLRTAFFVLNSIKVPLPTLEFRSNGTVVGHWMYF